MAAAVAALAAAAPAAAPAASATVLVRTPAEFQAAVLRLSGPGGTVLMAPGRYDGTLVVPPRTGPLLRILGRRGTRIERLLFDHTAHVSLGGMTVAPRTGDAWIELDGSRSILLHDLLVTAQGTRRSASVIVPDSHGITIRRTTFTHCGDRYLSWSNCLSLRGHASRVTVEDSWFHDCLGCDFIHGRWASGLTLRRNRFERALPCRMHVLIRVTTTLQPRCGHQDLVELFGGKWLVVEDNRFGVYRRGGAQLYLGSDVDHVRVRNNVFLARDPRAGPRRVHRGIYLGGHDRAPHDVEIVNNTILSGAPGKRGPAVSIGMTWAYKNVPRRDRPLIANNVIALYKWPQAVCSGARRSVRNVVVEGKGCSRSDALGAAHLDSLGRPTRASARLIGRADPRYAPARDITGRRRGIGKRGPDIGAYEYVPRR